MLDRNAILKPILVEVEVPELDGFFMVRMLTQGEAQGIADRFNDPDGADAEAAGKAVVFAALVDDEGTQLLQDPSEVDGLAAVVLQRILNALGYGETAIAGN